MARANRRRSARYQALSRAGKVKEDVTDAELKEGSVIGAAVGLHPLGFQSRGLRQISPSFSSCTADCCGECQAEAERDNSRRISRKMTISRSELLRKGD